MTATASAADLVQTARSQGIAVRAEVHRLVIRGPKGTEPTARALIKRKADVLAVLRDEVADTSEPARGKGNPFAQTWVIDPRQLTELNTALESPGAQPRGCCYACGSSIWWRRRDGREWFCPRCHPPIVSDVEQHEVGMEDGR